MSKRCWRPHLSLSSGDQFSEGRGLVSHTVAQRWPAAAPQTHKTRPDQAGAGTGVAAAAPGGSPGCWQWLPNGSGVALVLRTWWALGSAGPPAGLKPSGQMPEPSRLPQGPRTSTCWETMPTLLKGFSGQPVGLLLGLESPALGLLAAHSGPEVEARNPGFPRALLPPGAGALQLLPGLCSTSLPHWQLPEELCAQQAEGQEGTPGHPPALACGPHFAPLPERLPLFHSPSVQTCTLVGLASQMVDRTTGWRRAKQEAQPPSCGPGSYTAPRVASIQQQLFLV